jgi:hypothetical protein
MSPEQRAILQLWALLLPEESYVRIQRNNEAFTVTISDPEHIPFTINGDGDTIEAAIADAFTFAHELRSPDNPLPDQLREVFIATFGSVPMEHDT